MRLVQIARADGQRRVCAVQDDSLRALSAHYTMYELVAAALKSRESLASYAQSLLTTVCHDYNAIHAGTSEWHVLPVIDHPVDAARLHISGTGLTHQRSADQRQAMHAADAAPTDSLRMYEWGVEGGKPDAGCVGVAPEWFHKGNGSMLRGHNDSLVVPAHADDGGEEPEIAGVYFIDADGTPRRVGMATANEFSDHVLEKRNYLYLAASKLRTSAIGPELVLDPDFSDVRGTVSIERAGAVLWSRSVRTGEAAMCHSLGNLEHHHFKFDVHRRPGDLHIHYFGADAFSFGAGIALDDGDVMSVQFDGFGRALRNTVMIDRTAPSPISIRAV
jgi:hypothetical protein